MYSLMSTRIRAFLIGEEELRERARQLGFADTVGPQKMNERSGDPGP
jgi:hypothetical protein